MSTTEATARTQHLFLTHGVIAIAWAAGFAAVSDSPTADVTVGAGALIVLYPLIDAAASLIDARSQNGSARRLLLAGMLARRRRRAANPAARVLSAGRPHRQRSFHGFRDAHRASRRRSLGGGDRGAAAESLDA